jgi:hypothetical protein
LETVLPLEEGAVGAAATDLEVRRERRRELSRESSKRYRLRLRAANGAPPAAVPESAPERLSAKLMDSTSLADLEPIDWERQTSFEITGYVDHSPDRNALEIPLPWENA